MPEHEDDSVKVKILGDGDRKRKIIEVAKKGCRGLNLWFLIAFVGLGKEEPRIKDIELGKKLGYTQPSRIRDLIGRLITIGLINPLVELRTVTYRGMEIEVNIYWVTEEESLIIAAKSETGESNELLKEIIHVYMLARRGLLTQKNPPITNMSELLEIVKNNGKDVQSLRSEIKVGFSFIAEQNQDILLAQSEHEEAIIELREQASGRVGPTAARHLLEHAEIIVTQHVRRWIEDERRQGRIHTRQETEKFRCVFRGKLIQDMRTVAKWENDKTEIASTAGLPMAWRHLDKIGGESYREYVKKERERREQRKRQQLVMPFSKPRPRSN